MREQVAQFFPIAKSTPVVYSHAMKRDTHIIDELGGTFETSRLTGLSPAAISNWRVRGVPVHWKPKLYALAIERGIDLDIYDFLEIPKEKGEAVGKDAL